MLEIFFEYFNCTKIKHIYKGVLIRTGLIENIWNHVSMGGEYFHIPKYIIPTYSDKNILLSGNIVH